MASLARKRLTSLRRSPYTSAWHAIILICPSAARPRSIIGHVLRMRRVVFRFLVTFILAFTFPLLVTCPVTIFIWWRRFSCWTFHCWTNLSNLFYRLMFMFCSYLRVHSIFTINFPQHALLFNLFRLCLLLPFRDYIAVLPKFIMIKHKYCLVKFMILA